MKNIFSNPVFILLLVLTTFVSCKDDDDPQPSKTDILTQSTWTGSSVWFGGEDVSDQYMLLTGQDITKNTVKFDRNGTYLDSYEGATINGTWEFAENETKILFDKGTNSEDLSDLTKLDANEFIFTSSDDIEFRFTR